MIVGRSLRSMVALLCEFRWILVFFDSFYSLELRGPLRSVLIRHDLLYSESRLDPVEQIVPVVSHLIRIRATRAGSAGGNSMGETSKDNVVFIRAGGIILLKLFSVHVEVMCAHRGNEQRHRDILQRAGCRIVAGAPINLIVVHRIG